MFCREAVLIRLRELLAVFKPHFGFEIFDAFRSYTTQKALFHNFYQQVQIDNPNWDNEQVWQKAQRFVALPDDPQRHHAAPHNTGGAIDLSLIDLMTGKTMEFGNAIDSISDISRTDFFKQDFEPKHGIAEDVWLLARKNRRLLFNAMKYVGFANYHPEWWHYDLGDHIWAREYQTKPVFHSMAEELFSSNNQNEQLASYIRKG